MNYLDIGMNHIQAKEVLDAMGVTEKAGPKGQFRITRAPHERDNLALFVMAIRTLGAYSAVSRKSDVAVYAGQEENELVFRLKKAGEE